MTPVAYVSGTAGLALRIGGEGAKLCRIEFLRGSARETRANGSRADSGSKWVECDPEPVLRGMLEMSDLLRMEGEFETSDRIVLDKLMTEWKRDRALRNLLVALDRCEDLELRREGLRVLELLLNEERVPTKKPGNHDNPLMEYLKSVMSSAPLPPSGDAKTIRSAAGEDASDLLKWILEKQRRIRTIRDAWDAIPANAFGRETKDTMLSRAALAGVFRILADAEEEPRFGRPVRPYDMLEAMFAKNPSPSVLGWKENIRPCLAAAGMNREIELVEENFGHLLKLAELGL